MSAPHIKLIYCLFLLFYLTDTAIGQQSNPSEYPYGGILDRSGRLTFKENANFGIDKTDMIVYVKRDNFYGSSYYYEAIFNNFADFGNAEFKKEANFWLATFHEEASFKDVTFNGNAHYVEATFDRLADFYNVTFGGRSIFVNATFHDDAYFSITTFGNSTNFEGAIFHKDAIFWNATFRKEAYFGDATFDSLAHFNNATFEDVTLFHRTVFNTMVHFSGTTFKKEIDFRQTNFDSVTAIYLEDISFPEGKLFFYWEQFKGKDSLRIKLNDPPADSIKHKQYKRIEIIYHKLRDNFLAQGNKSSADNVMYELGWQRAEILDEFWWDVYGVFFGYGYQPWRFLSFVVTTFIILFAVIWYWFYYTLLVFINPSLFPKIVDASALKTKEKHFFKIKNIIDVKLPITDFKYGLENVNRLTRYWHSIFFSASVLLGIRFKKDWTTVFPSNMFGRKTFIYIVTLEWILGIGLYVTFALLVKGIRFSFIKDLLGF